MQPPYPAPVTEWHNDTYAAIDPSRPELSVRGKTVVITGGGTGIGRETVRAFALAGAAKIHILGRTKSNLEETKQIIEKDVQSASVTTHAADVTDEKVIKEVAATIGAWDVLVSNAGYLSKGSAIKDVDVQDWWLGMEVNLFYQMLLICPDDCADQRKRQPHCSKNFSSSRKSESFFCFGFLCYSELACYCSGRNVIL
jgi:NAD(P)-dependent dehydrogenase (short-subunit alcohol dehydrogenase family)